MRIGIIGNCMAAGTGMALRQILIDAEIYAFEAREVLRANLVDTTVDRLRECDAVFAHNLPPDYGGLGLKALQEIHPNAHRFPAGSFTGFHPDCVYFVHEGKQYASPLGAYHSAIAAAAFSLRLDVERTVRLFDAQVFRQLGYFDEFEKARRFLIHEFQQCGLEAAEEFARWLERGAFVHTINHPKGFMVAGVAKLLAVKLGLASRTMIAPELAYDVLSANAIWPVYPDLATAIGVGGGGYLFKRPGGPDFVKGLGVFLDLPEFVRLSFEKYAAVPADAFGAPAIARVGSILRALV